VWIHQSGINRLIEQALLEAQIDEETMVLACIWLEVFLSRLNDMNIDVV
jgi:hypothetical protein